MATASIVGGAGVTLSLDPAEIAAAQQALIALGQGFTQGNVITNPNTGTKSGKLNVYNIPGTSPFQMPQGAQGVVLTGSANAKITGHGLSGGTQLLIGNQGNDTINGLGGKGSIIAGDGANTIQLNNTGLSGGEYNILVGSGADKILMWGGKVTLSSIGGAIKNVYMGSGNNQLSGASGIAVHLQGGNDTVSLTGPNNIAYADGAAGSNVNAKVALGTGGKLFFNEANNASANVTLSGGTANTVDFASGNNTLTSALNLTITEHGGKNVMNLTGNDTIYLGSGQDTVIDTGSATVYAGSGAASVRGGSGANLLVGGSGYSTLIGGTGINTFIGKTGHASMVGGSGVNKFTAGVGDETMVGGASADVFTFNKTAASAHDVIKSFGTGDKIHLVGYDTAAALAGAHVVGGNTVISLDGGATKIEIVGFTHLTSNSFG